MRFRVLRDFAVEMNSLEQIMKSLAVIKPNQLKIVDVPKPKINDYQALVEIISASICNSTDIKLIHGTFPGMGLECYPLLLGHETVGRVVKVGKKVVSFKKGDIVVGALLEKSPSKKYRPGWGGFSEYCIAGDFFALVRDGIMTPEEGLQEIYEVQKVIPRDLEADEATMICTMREVVSGIRSFNFQPGKSVLIYGTGPVALSFVKLSKIFGMFPVAVASFPRWKLDVAKKLGADAVIDNEKQPAAEILKKMKLTSFDFVVDAVGSEKIINEALELVKSEGAICVYGTVPSAEIKLQKARAPYNWNLLIHQWPTRQYEAQAHQLIVDYARLGIIDFKPFITKKFTIAEYEKAFAMVERNEALKVVLKFKG